jgi:hypothetical protein
VSAGSDEKTYVRQLEDACLVMWGRMTPQEFIDLRRELPDLATFLAHLNHAISYEESQMRRSVWAT